MILIFLLQKNKSSSTSSQNQITQPEEEPANTPNRHDEVLLSNICVKEEAKHIPAALHEGKAIINYYDI